MREARLHGMSRNMATPSTYYWFYQKVRNGGLWDYKKFDPYFAAFGNFNFGAAGTAAGIPANILLMGAGWAQGRAGKDTDIIHQLAMKYPVIEGTGTITSASIDTNGEVKITYSGKVISIESNISDLRFSVKP
ncbi:hypothetical protein L1887_45423 [Cichorium endivia]|nr:hypothetical protein L1887_45423 [Cichorium endivia]